MKLDELLRRQDVCFFCGYAIGIAGQTKCPECGKERPTAEEIGRVRRSRWVGIAGAIALVLTIAAVVLLVVYDYSSTRGDPYRMLVRLGYGAPLVIVAGLAWPWVYLARFRAEMLGGARNWRLFVAIYPWLLCAFVLAWTIVVALGT